MAYKRNDYNNYAVATNDSWFRGFPKELSNVQYPTPGDPVLAMETSRLIGTTNVGLDHDWRLDHGTWTVVKHMYPNTNIPVLLWISAKA